MHDPHINRRGIFLMIAGSSFFAANDACSKVALTYVPPSQILALRGVMAAILLIVLIVARGELSGTRHMFDRRVLMRAGTEAAGTMMYITALTAMALGDAAAIMQVGPLVTMAAAVIFFGAKLSWQRWIAVITGFIGVGLIMKPASGAFQPIALLPLGVAFLVTFRDFVTGRIGPHIQTLVVTLVTALASMALGFALSSVEQWKPLDTAALIPLALGSLMMVMGHMLTIAAFRGTDPSLISPFRYSTVVCAAALGALLFDTVPDLLAIVGMALIVGAGLYTMHSQRPRAVAKAAA